MGVHDGPEYARTKKEINKAAKSGYRPLVKEAIYSKEYFSKLCVLQNKESGEVKVIGDFRSSGDYDGFEPVTDWLNKYDIPKNPFAAYIIPPDIKVGERVVLEDLIENYVGGTWNQGDCWRLDTTTAIWNGKDFDIEYSGASIVMG